MLWDSYYERTNAEIARNKNPGSGWHCLFIMIRGYDTREYPTKFYIEPSTKDFSKYNMYDYWGKEYNPAFNIYGETFKWLNERKF